MRTQAEYIALANEVQRLRAQLEATQRELSNARVARDQARTERDSLRHELAEIDAECASLCTGVSRG